MWCARPTQFVLVSLKHNNDVQKYCIYIIIYIGDAVLYVVEKPPEHHGAVVAAIVIACVVGVAVLCWMVSVAVDCALHVYKYWCGCLRRHRARRMNGYRQSGGGRGDHTCMSSATSSAHQLAASSAATCGGGGDTPTILILRALPPSYSTIVVSCDRTSSVSQASPILSRVGCGPGSRTKCARCGGHATSSADVDVASLLSSSLASAPPLPPSYSSIFTNASSNNNNNSNTSNNNNCLVPSVRLTQDGGGRLTVDTLLNSHR
jgi:hypothetical protein